MKFLTYKILKRIDLSIVSRRDTLLRTKNNWIFLLKKHFIKMAGIMLAFAIIAPAQAQTIRPPTPNRSSATYTILENATGTLSGASLSMSHSEELHYAIFQSSYTPTGDYGWWIYFDANNQTKNPNSNTQPVTIDYNNVNYERAPSLNSGRGHRMIVIGCPPGADSHDGECANIEITVRITDVPELNTMDGRIRVVTDSTDSNLNNAIVGDILTADFSDISDEEGINNLSIRWSRQTCTASRSLGRWNVSQIVGNRDTYELTVNDAGQAVTVWGQYRTDTNNYKWVCKDVLGSVNSPSAVENNPPVGNISSHTYTLDENAGRFINSEDLAMRDPENEVIRYSIISLNGDSAEEAELRSIFRVNNTDPYLYNDTDNTGYQPIELISNINFNYEETPEYVASARGYQFGIKGCDSADQCTLITVTIIVNDVSEISLSSGQIVITGRVSVGEALTADFSNFSDPEATEQLKYGNGKIHWRLGACTATYGVGELPTQNSSSVSYERLSNGPSYTIASENVGQTISVWGTYRTNVGLKWVCKQTRVVSSNSSLPNIFISSSSRSVIAKKSIEVTLRRTNVNLSSSLVVSLRKNQGSPENFERVFSPNEREKTFEVTALTEGENLIVEVLHSEGYNFPSVSSVTVPVTPYNRAPAGQLSISGTTQVGETLTVDTSGITDANGISGNFSYTWWKEIDFGSDDGIPQKISGATGSTYTIRPADARSKIKVKASYIDDNGFSHNLESALTGRVIPVADTKPYILDINFKQDVYNQGNFVNPGSNFEATPGDAIRIAVYMSKGVSGLSPVSGDVYMRLNIGSQTRILDRSSISGENNPNRLIFYYTVEAGVSGRVTIPRNGMFIEGIRTGVISNPSNINLNYPQVNLGNMRIQDSINMSIIGSTVYENTSGYLYFTVRLNKPATETITVDWATADGTAKAGLDYRANSGMLTFNPGDKVKSFRLNIIDDTIEEERETFQVNLSNLNPSSVRFTNASATGTIVNSDPDVSEPDVSEPDVEEPDVEDIASSVTASFQNMPTEHNGSGRKGRFTFKLKISERLRDKSKRSLKNALSITNGKLIDVRKVATRDYWNVIVEPSSTATMTISFNPQTDCTNIYAPCTDDGRAVSNSFSNTVLGPAMVSIGDASANENTDTSMSFVVTLNRAATRIVAVQWATADNTATAGADYVSNSGFLVFYVGETSQTITVDILNDSVNEGSESFYVNLIDSSNGVQIADSQGVGTINNIDPMPSAYLSRFGRTVGGQAVDAISSRMGASTDNKVMIGGVEMSLTEEKEGTGASLQNIHQQFESSKGSMSERIISLEEMAQGTSFNLSGENKSTGRSWSAWGEFASDNFKGEEDNVSVEGKVTTGFLGADVANGHWRGGVALSRSNGEGTFQSLGSTEDKGEVESSLTSIYPYAGYEFGENKAVWGMLGFGEGDITVTQLANENRNRNQTTKADVSMQMGAVGAKGPLLSQSEGDGMDMVLQADGMYLQIDSEDVPGMSASKSEVTRLRLTADSSKKFEVGGGTLRPSVQLGVRQDGGDAEEGTGLEAGGGLRYESGRISIEGNVRKLLVHEVKKYEEWGASAAIRIRPDKSGRGLSLSVVPSWGASSSEVDRLWSSEGLHTLGGSESFTASERLEAEVAYGLWKPFPFLKQGLLEPFLGVSMSDDNKTYRTGTRLNIAPNATLSLGFDHTKNQSTEEDVLMLRGRFRW